MVKILVLINRNFYILYYFILKIDYYKKIFFEILSYSFEILIINNK